MGWFHAAYAAGELDFDGEGGGGGTCSLPPKKVQVPPCPKTLTGIEVIYHMCQKAQWDEAVEERGAYFPPTFHKDGKFTRASIFKEGLIDVANEFYKQSPGEWICLELNLKLMLDMGIVILPQAVEDENNSNNEDEKEQKTDDETPVQCLQVYSGITTVVPGLVTSIYGMKRSPCGSGTFLSLEEPSPFKARRHPTVPKEPKRSQSPKKTEQQQQQEATKIPGVGSVPAAKAKPEQPAETTKKSNKSGFSKMFGSSKKK